MLRPKEDEGCEAHHISVHLEQLQRAPPARTVAKVTCSRGSPTGAKPGRDAPRRAHRPSPAISTKGALHLFTTKLEPGMFGTSKFLVFDIDEFLKLAQAMTIRHSPGIQMPPRCFSICCTAPREPSPISRHWDKPRVRDEMRWGCTLQEDCFFRLGDRFVSSRSTA